MNRGFRKKRYYTYLILNIEEKERFSKPAKLLTVEIYANTLDRKTFVEKTLRWETQLF